MVIRVARSAIRQVLLRLLGADRLQQLRFRLGDVASAFAYRSLPTGRRSARELRRLRDSARGRTCVIIGNGPSLNSMDLSVLKGIDTFGLNRGYLLFPRIGGATKYLVSVNEFVIEQSALEMLAAPGTKFFSWRHRRHVASSRRDVVFLRSVHLPSFSTDLASKGLWEGATVTFVALQLAYHLGYRDVVLIGVDHSFTTAGPAHQLVTSTGSDPNHFDPSYFGVGYRWQLPDLETSEVAYRMARSAFETADGSIVDATVGGKLTVFRKADFREVIGRL
jgi:hypothetical protein